MEMTQTAKLLYALLLDRTTLSQKNGWQDEYGRTYIIFPITAMADALDKSPSTVKEALNELDRAGLLERKRLGFSAANRLYVKLPLEVRVLVPMESENPYLISPGNCITDSQKTGHMKSEKPAPNNYNINKTKESHQMGASGEPPAPFGRYKNLFLSASEYAELKREYPDRLGRFIEELSEFIAATGKVYANHAAAVRMWARRDRKGTGKKGIPDYTYKEGESL